MGKKERISVITMGCSKNLVDSETLLGQLKLNNARLTDNVGEAETIVVNTCGFIEAAKQESIDAILEAVERKKKGELKKVIVMGCLSERYKTELKLEIPEVDGFFGSNAMQEIVRNLGADFKRELLGERVITTPGHFAYLKISEGCDNPCSFCAIPIMRGRHRSKPEEQVLAEAHSLASHGVKELILIAQDSTYYGLDLYGERRLDSLLNELCALEGIEWIRLLYAYPAKFPLAVLQTFRNQAKICRYLDIPVQHIADDVLKSMRRGISSHATRQLLETIKNTVPGIALRTTLIVGYPQETEKDFQVLYDFVKEMQFHRLGVFTYSQEEGTSAFSLDDPIPNAVKEERKNMLMELQQSISENRNETLIGTTSRVIIDDAKDGSYIGRTEWDAPEIDQEVIIESSTELVPGSFHDVQITGSTEYDLFASILP